MMSITLRDADIIKLGDDEGSELGSSDGSFDSSSDGNLDSSLIGDSLGSYLEIELGSFVVGMNISSLTTHYWENHWDIMMGLCLDAMKALNLVYLMLKLWVQHLDMHKESNLVMMKDER